MTSKERAEQVEILARELLLKMVKHVGLPQAGEKRQLAEYVFDLATEFVDEGSERWDLTDEDDG